MSRDNVISGKVESPKEIHRTKKPLDLNEVEMVFGTPNSPKGDFKPDMHLITDERNHIKKTASNHKNNIDVHNGETIQPTQPLLEPDREKQKPPLAGPEIDDLDDGKPTDAAPYPGIDDGLLEPGETKPDGYDDDGGEKSTREGSGHPTVDDGVGTEDGKWPWHDTDETDYPYDGVNGFGNRFGIDDRPGSPIQPGIAVGVGLIMNSRYNVKDEKDICKADKINNMTVLGVFLVTIVNVFITSFSVATPNTVGAVDGMVVQQAG